jgi:ribose-phosphate pyrophosphokinase
MDIADKLGVSLTEANLREFADGEIHCRFDESIRGAHVFIVQTHATPVNDAVMEQLIMIDAAKRASFRTTATPAKIASPRAVSRSPRN